MTTKMIKPLIFLCITVLSVSCKKKIDEAYQNPNAQVVEPIESILPGVIGGFTYFYSANGTGFGEVGDAQYIGRYIQYWTTQTDQENYAEMGGVTGASDVTGALWGTVYYGQGQNVNKIIQWGTEQQKWDYVGVAWAIRGWGWLDLTDEYSDGPLREAFNTNLQQFDYDPQPAFYDSSRAACLRAISFLSRTDGNVSQANLAKGDAYFYNGDVNKWKKFAYGVLARSYQSLSSKTLYTTNHYADSAIKYASLSLSTNDDNAYVRVSGTGIPPSATYNYFGPYRGNIGAYRQCAYIADLMSGRNSTVFNGVSDPRAWYMLRENQSETFTGFIPWRGANTPGITTATYPYNYWGNWVTPSSTAPPAIDTSRYLYQNTPPWPIMTASEMQFIIAEASYLKGDKATALAAYTNGINLNFDMLSTTYPQHIPAAAMITPAVKAAYLQNTAIVPSSPAGLTLSQIMLQKYIALYGWGSQETWVDMRKYHYTDADPATGTQVYADFTLPSGQYLVSTNNGKPVYRLKPRYNSEYLYDVPSLTKIGAFNPDYNTYEMWFSQK